MSLSELKLETEYRSAQSDLATRFYHWCLNRSIHYDRAAGYFSSTVFIVFGAAVVDFARRGGKIRIICSPQLSAEDLEALKAGHTELAALATTRLMEELEALFAVPSADAHVKTLATLVALSALELRIGVRATGHGIFHEKLGVFEDLDGNAVSFVGSANETWKGWHPEGNYEAIEVFCSWLPDAPRVAKHRAHFARIWEGRDPSLTVIDFPEAVRRRLCSVAATSLEDLEIPRTVRSTGPTPRNHQAAALQSWMDNGYRGIFRHATGSGKTLTALFAMQPHVNDGGVVIVLVPSQLLVDQWETEIRGFFSDPNLLLAGAGNDAWKREGALRSFTSSDRLLGGRIVLVTMQTARSPLFVGRVRQGHHLLVIADEVHQIGSAENAHVLALDAGKRLGLSATPERYGDPGGTQKIKHYFGETVPPDYTLPDAIADGHLVPYEYHPSVVNLTDSEAHEWRRLSHDISVAVARAHSAGSPDPLLSNKIELLLMQRARIAKKAENKQVVSQSILRGDYRPGQRWLVYCEDQDQLREIVRLTSPWCKDVLEYHTAMAGDPKATLRWFQEHGGILIAIACLDEGVNIPSISHALILASSQNPRQFIQRRGRILRKFPGKRIATIHDVLVSPENVDDEPTQRSLLKSELRRALEFAGSAANLSARAALRLIALRAGINPDSVDDAGTEQSDFEGGSSSV